MIHMQRKYNWNLIPIHADRYEMKSNAMRLLLTFDENLTLRVFISDIYAVLPLIIVSSVLDDACMDCLFNPEFVSSSIRDPPVGVLPRRLNVRFGDYAAKRHDLVFFDALVLEGFENLKRFLCRFRRMFSYNSLIFTCSCWPLNVFLEV